VKRIIASIESRWLFLRGKDFLTQARRRSFSNTLKKKPRSERGDNSDQSIIDHHAPTCPYCGAKGELKDKKWHCPSCSDVSVGTYEGSSRPLGTLADKDTRIWRMRAHDELTFKWEEGDSFEDFYGWIASHVKKSYKQSTIANLNKDECQRIIKAGRKELYNRRYREIFDQPKNKVRRRG